MEDIEALRAAKAAHDDVEEEVAVEEDVEPKRINKTAQHIRANSSIMHLNKLLGRSSRPSCCGCRL